MTLEEKKIFAHHDKIARSRPGSLLMVCEPCKVVNMHEGGIVELSPGQTLRVKVAMAGLLCEVATGGRVVSVALQAERFHCVEQVQ